MLTFNILPLFFTLIAVGLVFLGLYLAGGFFVRQRRESPIGSFLAQLPFYHHLEEEAVIEVTQREEEIEASMLTVDSPAKKEAQVRAMQPNRSSVKIQLPQTGESITFTVAGTQVIRWLTQADQSSNANPWYGDSKLVSLHALVGAKSGWIMELPQGYWAYFQDYYPATNPLLQRVVEAGKQFGKLKQASEDIFFEDAGNRYFIEDIARAGLAFENLDRTGVYDFPWSNAAQRDFGTDEWPVAHHLALIVASTRLEGLQVGDSLFISLLTKGNVSGWFFKGTVIHPGSIEKVYGGAL